MLSLPANTRVSLCIAPVDGSSDKFVPSFMDGHDF